MPATAVGVGFASEVLKTPAHAHFDIYTVQEAARQRPKTIGERLRQRRLELKLCLSEAAPRMGVSVPTLGLWELGTVFPKHCYHAKITAFLDHDPFPKEGFDSFHSLPS